VGQSSTNDHIATLNEAELELNDPPQIRWVLVRDVLQYLWRDNPKLHNIGDVINSIKEHGYQELCKYDVNLPNVQGGTGAWKAGNGRVEALDWMERDGSYELPRGLGRAKDGSWACPGLFGTDAKSKAAAEAYGVDSNNLVLSGGDFSAFDHLRLWDDTKYLELVTSMAQDNEFPVTVDGDVLDTLIAYHQSPLGGNQGDFPKYVTEIIEVAKLQDHPDNYREHPADQVEHIKASIEEHGFYRNIVVANDNTILAGHGVVVALRQMDMPFVPIRRLDIEPNDPQALKILTADNEISHLGVIDDRKLTEILKEIRELGDNGLLGTGFDDQMLANLLFITRPKSEIESIDHAAHWVGMPEFENAPERYQLKLYFDTPEEQLKLAKELGVENARVAGKTLSSWYPPREKQDLTGVKFEGE
jgi:hypothetical protein